MALRFAARARRARSTACACLRRTWAAASSRPRSRALADLARWSRGSSPRMTMSGASGASSRALRAPGAPRVFLGFGREDRFADSQRLLARALPAGCRWVIEGGHDWPVWRRLWDNFLDRLGERSIASELKAHLIHRIRPLPTSQARRPGRSPSGAGGPRRCCAASIGLHAGAALLAALPPRWWPWALGARVADHLRSPALGLWPRSHALGSNWTRLPARRRRTRRVAITIDDGPDPEVTPAVLTILGRHGARATLLLHRRARRRDSRSCARDLAARRPCGREPQRAPSTRFSLFGPARLRRKSRARSRLLGEPAAPRRASSARPRACATRCSIRRCSGADCSWPAGRAAVSTPSAADAASSWRA